MRGPSVGLVRTTWHERGEAYANYTEMLQKDTNVLYALERKWTFEEKVAGQVRGWWITATRWETFGAGCVTPVTEP